MAFDRPHRLELDELRNIDLRHEKSIRGLDRALSRAEVDVRAVELELALSDAGKVVFGDRSPRIDPLPVQMPAQVPAAPTADEQFEALALDIRRFVDAVASWRGRPLTGRLGLGKPKWNEAQRLSDAVRDAQSRAVYETAVARKTLRLRREGAQAHFLDLRQRTERQLTEAHLSALNLLIGALRPVIFAEDSDPMLGSGPFRPEGRAQPAGLLRIGTCDMQQLVLVDDKFGAAPAVLEYPFRHPLIFFTNQQHRAMGLQEIFNLTLRLLGAHRPGSLRLSFVDPSALGASLSQLQHLADYDPDLVGVAPATTSQSISRELTRLQQFIEAINSKYLRGQYATMAEYRAQAGDTPEPTQLLLVFDFPHAFTFETAQQLLSIMSNGPACGVFTALHADDTQQLPHGFAWPAFQSCGYAFVPAADSAPDAFAVTPPGGPDLPYRIHTETLPQVQFDASQTPRTWTASLLRAIGIASKNSVADTVTPESVYRQLNHPGESDLGSDLVVAPDPADPATWWHTVTTHTAIGLVGRAGLRKPAGLRFSSEEVAGGAVIVGLPRSGKTTALHAAILSMAMTYSPDELELYLVDAKNGVEFNCYITLPHARVISLHSEREFGVAVLRSLRTLIDVRARLMKQSEGGATNITEYRETTGRPMSRVVLIMDEFQELFEVPDHLGTEAFDLFSDLARMGPAFGIHLVLASQTLASIAGMNNEVLRLLPERMLFMCNDSDADLLLEQGNRGARMLTRQGDALLNLHRGLEKYNVMFRGMYFPLENRGRLVRALAAHATARRTGVRPLFYDSQTPAERPDDHIAGNDHVVIGEPFDLSACFAIPLVRERGSNIALIGKRGSGAPHDANTGAVESLLRAAVYLKYHIDFRSTPAQRQTWTSRLGAGGTNHVMFGAEGFTPVISRLADNLLQRMSDNPPSDAAAPILLVLDGTERALDLADPDVVAPHPGEPIDSPARAAQALAWLLVQGPEYGVHVALTASTHTALQSRLGRRLCGELGWRIGAGNLSHEDRRWIIGDYGSDIPLSGTQILVGDSLQGETHKLRGYAPTPAPTLIEQEV